LAADGAITEHVRLANRGGCRRGRIGVDRNCLAGTCSSIGLNGAGRLTVPDDLESHSRGVGHRAAFKVALVAMPFVTVCRPSIQLGLLTAIARSNGFPVSDFHLALDFAHQIGPEIYGALAQHRGHLFGDWLFSVAAFGEEAPDSDAELLHDFNASIKAAFGILGKNPAAYLRRLRDIEVPKFLDRMMGSIAWGGFRVVGFTSTFQQNTASFALAGRIKRQHPDVCVLFGGANFDGEMGSELVRSVRCIDYAVVGEADLAFPEFLKALAQRRDPADVPGVVRRRHDQVSAPAMASPFTRMNELPIPDYDGYFARARSVGLLKRGGERQVALPVESSRGCWWGQKQHCTFCGLNAENMAFRAKSPERFLNELTELAHRYRTMRFESVDNILDMSYMTGLFPELVKNGYHFNLFYETKANLRRDQVRLLREAGVECIQPGIESLSTHVLQLMRKGVTAIQNVNLLRWATYYDLRVFWNIIWGLPNEHEEDYVQQTELIPQIAHLQPPASVSRIWMERFSPIYAQRERFQMRFVRPEASYAYVYPEYVNLERSAYFFDYEFEDALPGSAYEPLTCAVRRWQHTWQAPVRPKMTFSYTPKYLCIEDRRICDEPVSYTFTGPLASIYAAASDRQKTADNLKKSLALEWSQTKIVDTLQKLCTLRLMMREGDAFLSLALPSQPGR
jgi:ribosomal peptide maturation radical SAM protein 1